MAGALPAVPRCLGALQPFVRRGQEFLAGALAMEGWEPARTCAMAHLCFAYADRMGNEAALALEAAAKRPDADGAAALAALPGVDAFLMMLGRARDESARFRHADDDKDLGECSLFLFDRADAEEVAGRASKTTARAFYTSRLLMDVSQLFGELPHMVAQRRKYAQWRANTITRALLVASTLPPYRGWWSFYEDLEVEHVKRAHAELSAASRHLFENLVTEHHDADAAMADAPMTDAGGGGTTLASSSSSSSTSAPTASSSSSSLHAAPKVEDVYTWADADRSTLGRGSFGVVRRVTHRRSRRQYAMKTLQVHIRPPPTR
jgi:vacuolar protein sorting-associated protein VTA1